MKKLYRFAWDCGRMGDVRGLFVADDEKDIAPAIGKRVYFGEILGKHSEVHGTLEEKDLTVLAGDAAFVAKFVEYDCASGYNPLQYITCPDCGDALPTPYKKCRHKSCGWKV